MPFTAKTPTTVADLLALVTAEPDSALKAVYRDGNKLADDAEVKAGDVLRFYANGSTVTADYKVVAEERLELGRRVQDRHGRGLELPEAERRRR